MGAFHECMLTDLSNVLQRSIIAASWRKLEVDAELSCRSCIPATRTSQCLETLLTPMQQHDPPFAACRRR